MSTKVYANGREISAKKDANKVIAAMPDVCLSPPSPPAGPLPIPYPNFSQDSDTSSGSKSVLIRGKEAGLKNKSNFKKSRGDMAATRSFGMGVVTHTLEGKTKHAAWSFNVKFEGKNVTRHLDLSTHNHINNPNSACSGIKVGDMEAPGGDPDCVELENMTREAIEQDSPNQELANNEVIAAAKHSGGGYFKAVQPGKDWVNTSKDNGYSQSHGKATVTCTNIPYNTNSQGNCDHCESKMLEHLFGGNRTPGGALTMRINWNNGGNLSDSPCQQCMGTICKTAQACNIDIFICKGDADNMQKKKAPCKSTTHKKGKSKGKTTHKWVSKLWD